MKKETLIAIIFGVGLGVILAVIFIMQSKENQLAKTKTINNLNKTVTPKLKMVTTPTLEISEPTDNLIVNSNSITISGKANKNALIVIHSPVKDLVFKNEKEEFKINFPLALGENVIQLTVYPDDKTVNKIMADGTKKFFLVEGIYRAQELGNLKTLNIFMLGCVSIFLPMKVKTWQDCITSRLPAAAHQINLRAFTLGRKEINEYLA